MKKKEWKYYNDDGEVLDKYHLHEATDRAHVMASMFEEHLLDHPAVSGNQKAKKKAEKIMKQLSDFYQICANLRL